MSLKCIRVPPRAETFGDTERIIGDWLQERRNRARVILATKVTSRSGMNWIRGGPRLQKKQIIEACDESLKRLQTDYIDLYQLHWPDRSANFFGQFDYKAQEDAEDTTPIEEQLETLSQLIEAGKIRHIGLSNETPWGVMRFLYLSATRGWPRVVSVQNPYSLLNRSFDIGLAEVAMRERCGLLAYSPLAFGVLSGKYIGGKKPEGARLTLFGSIFQRYTQERAQKATQAYVSIAKDHGLDPSVMALAFINQRAWLTSNLIGATTMEQLRINISSASVSLSQKVLDAIEAVHQESPNPCP